MMIRDHIQSRARKQAFDEGREQMSDKKSLLCLISYQSLPNGRGSEYFWLGSIFVCPRNY